MCGCMLSGEDGQKRHAPAWERRYWLLYLNPWTNVCGVRLVQLRLLVKSGEGGHVDSLDAEAEDYALGIDRGFVARGTICADSDKF